MFPPIQGIRMPDPAPSNPSEDAAALEAEVDTAIAACGGDVRSALRATLVANAYLGAELERVLEMVSAGYGRGTVRQIPERRPEKKTG